MDMWQEPKQGRSQEFVFFFIIRGTNHANLYKNLIKIQIFNVNLGAIGGPGPCPPVYAPERKQYYMCILR